MSTTIAGTGSPSPLPWITANSKLGAAAPAATGVSSPAAQHTPPLPEAAPASGAIALAEPAPRATLDSTVTLSRLDGLQASAVNIEQIAQIIQKQNQEAREAGRIDRQEQRDISASANQKAADDIRSQAVFDLVATCVSAAFSIVGAAVSLKGGMDEPSASEETPAANLSKLDDEEIELTTMSPKQGDEELPEGLDGAGDLQKAAKEAKGLGDLKAAERREATARLKGKMVEDLGKIAGSGFKMGGDYAAADQAAQKAKASSASSKADDDTDFIHAYVENIKSIQDKLAAMQQADNESMRQIINA